MVNLVSEEAGGDVFQTDRVWKGSERLDAKKSDGTGRVVSIDCNIGMPRE